MRTTTKRRLFYAQRPADIYSQIGDKIRELRTSLGGKGISQGELEQAKKTTANAISRRESAIYKPSLSDLERLVRFFGVPVRAFSPDLQPSSQVRAVLSATPWSG